MMLKSNSEGKEPQTMTSSTLMSVGLVEYGFLFTHIYVCMYVFGRRKCHTMARQRKSEDSFWESVFSPYHMGSEMLGP